MRTFTRSLNATRWKMNCMAKNGKPKARCDMFSGIQSMLLTILVVAVFSFQWFPQSVLAKVTIVGGSDITADEETVNEILVAFDRAEAAIQARDLDGILGLYSKRYNYHRLKKSDARRLWEEILEYHHKLHSTHLFTEIKTAEVNGELRAEVKCTGALWGYANETEQKVTVDSWFEEVHYLVKEDGAWRIIGNAGTVPETPRFGHAPHPLF